MGFIFEAEIEAIIHAVKVKTIGEYDTVYLKNILSANIHPSIKAYIKSEIEKKLQQEKSHEKRSKIFNYSIPEIKSLEERIDILLVHNYCFNKEEYESVLDEAVHFEFNYLCRPQWTLMNFIIGDKTKISASTIESKLNYCIDYSYFPELIRRFVVERGLSEITYEELNELIKKIDNEVIDRHTNKELARMTKALFDFVESGKMLPRHEFEQQTLPIDAAIVFFADKNLSDIANRLEYERDKNRLLQISVTKLEEVICSVRYEENIENVSEKTKYSETIQENHQLLEDIDIEYKSNENIIAKEEEHFTPKKDKKQIILDLFTEKERSMLMKKLFENEFSAFHGAILEISHQDNWADASEYLEKLFTSNNIDPFSMPAVLFTDKLFAHFNSDNK